MAIIKNFELNPLKTKAQLLNLKIFHCHMAID